jgi:hypothetical protein
LVPGLATVLTILPTAIPYNRGGAVSFLPDRDIYAL